MGYREAKELAELRQQLRDRLVAQDVGGANVPLARLRQVAVSEGDLELRAEYERWSFRFELLAA
jgi:hypothetical protein